MDICHCRLAALVYDQALSPSKFSIVIDICVHHSNATFLFIHFHCKLWHQLQHRPKNIAYRSFAWLNMKIKCKFVHILTQIHFYCLHFNSFISKWWHNVVIVIIIIIILNIAIVRIVLAHKKRLRQTNFSNAFKIDNFNYTFLQHLSTNPFYFHLQRFKSQSRVSNKGNYSGGWFQWSP